MQAFIETRRDVLPPEIVFVHGMQASTSFTAFENGVLQNGSGPLPVPEPTSLRSLLIAAAFFRVLLSSYSVWMSTQISFIGEPEQQSRGFLYFDLTSITATVNGATLRFNVDSLASGPPGPAFGGITLYDVTTTAGSSKPDRWADLGSGEHYGGKGLREDVDVGFVVEAQLSATAVANINSAAEPFGIGVVGKVDHWSGVLRTSDYELLLDTSPAAVPEPQSLIIFAAYTLLGFLTCRRRFGGSQ